MLDGYELVPEAYGQKFQNCEKKKDQPGLLFHKCCQASKVKDFAKLKELVLFEDFKKCMW